MLTQIPMRKSRKIRVGMDHSLDSLRSLVERCFNNPKNACRVATRYDKTADLSPAGPSFITKACRLDLGIPVPRMGQLRRARSPQMAQALGAHGQQGSDIPRPSAGVRCYILRPRR